MTPPICGQPPAQELEPAKERQEQSLFAEPTRA
jgi:hypothetical protein